MSEFVTWEPGEAVRVQFSWEVWAEGESLTDGSVTHHPDLSISDFVLNGYTATVVIAVSDTQALGSELWFRFLAESGPRKAARTQRVRVGYRPPVRE